MFLTGQAEIDKAIIKMNDAVACLPEGSCMPLMLLPLYASLPPDLQVPFNRHMSWVLKQMHSSKNNNSRRAAACATQVHAGPSF